MVTESITENRILLLSKIFMLNLNQFFPVVVTDQPERRQLTRTMKLLPHIQEGTMFISKENMRDIYKLKYRLKVCQKLFFFFILFTHF